MLDLKYKINPDLNLDENILPPISLQTASQKELLQHNIAKVVKKMQLHEVDTGSSQVQSMFNNFIFFYF